MTRENKAGLVVAGSFLVLAAVVLTLKVREHGVPPEPDPDAEPSARALAMSLPSATPPGPAGKAPPAAKGNPLAPAALPPAVTPTPTPTPAPVPALAPAPGRAR